MREDDQELLWRRVFGDLTPEENAELDQRLHQEPELAAALAEYAGEFTACQRDLAADEASESNAPDRLIDRTLDAVLNADGTVSERLPPASGRGRYTLTDLLAVAVAACLLGALLLPAINFSREQARRIQCASNLKSLGQSLVAYADNHADRFPRLTPYSNAGVFAVRLAEEGYLDRAEASSSLLCPSSELAGRVAAGQAAIYVPNAWELTAADGLVLDRLRRLMAGSYAYRLGHYENGVFRSPENHQDTRRPLLADAQFRRADGTVFGRNHGECGQNVLFEDGRVAFQRDCWSPCLSNHLYLNDDGRVAAGKQRNDVVLGPSGATPGLITPAVYRVGP
ncbi:MAG: hypothetical protein AAF805_03140 [Planctomycetota bacterium]